MNSRLNLPQWPIKVQFLVQFQNKKKMENKRHLFFSKNPAHKTRHGTDIRNKEGKKGIELMNPPAVKGIPSGARRPRAKALGRRAPVSFCQCAELTNKSRSSELSRLFVKICSGAA